MAQYFTDDFADFTSGGPPNYGDWTVRIKTAVSWTPAADVVIPQASSGDWNLLSWNDVEDGNHANIEVLALVTTTGTSRHSLAVRASGADESATLYSMHWAGSTLRVYYCAGADTPTQVVSVSKTHSTNTNYWIRYKVTGASPTSLYVKSWTGTLASEPGTWDINGTTDSSGPQVAGWNGLGDYSLGGGVTVRQIGVGTNGDAAPGAALGAGFIARRPLTFLQAVRRASSY